MKPNNNDPETLERELKNVHKKINEMVTKYHQGVKPDPEEIEHCANLIGSMVQLVVEGTFNPYGMFIPHTRQHVPSEFEKNLFCHAAILIGWYITMIGTLKRENVLKVEKEASFSLNKMWDIFNGVR